MPPERRTQGFSVAHRAKRRAFAEAAWRVFLRDGLGGTTARAIAAETGASVGALYTYFPGTESVVQDLALGSLTKLARKVAVSVASEPGAGAKKIAAAVDEILEFYGPGTKASSLLSVLVGGTHNGNGSDVGARVNGKLISALSPVAVAYKSAGSDQKRAEAKAVGLGCFVIGLALFQSTGRLGALGISAKNVTEAFLTDALQT